MLEERTDPSSLPFLRPSPSRLRPYLNPDGVLPPTRRRPLGRSILLPILQAASVRPLTRPSRPGGRRRSLCVEGQEHEADLLSQRRLRLPHPPRRRRRAQGGPVRRCEFFPFLRLLSSPQANRLNLLLCLRHSQYDSSGPFPPAPLSSSSQPYWYITTSPMGFENVGFSRTVPPSHTLPSNLPKGNLKYLICADCDLGPLGWTMEGSKEAWVGVERVGYGQEEEKSS